MFVNSYIDYNLVSRFSGSGLSSTNNRLESLPSSGTNSPAYFLSASGDNNFWHNDASDTSYPATESHFLLSFDKPSVPPTGDIRVHIVNNLFDMYNDTYFNKLTLWYLKENNPHLTQDYLIASGNVDLHAAPPGLDWNTINVALLTEPINNYSPGINGYMSLSGAWLFAGPDPSGSVLIDSIYLRIDGNAIPYENNFTCNLINSTLYTKTYTPNVNSDNRFHGSGFINFDDVQLQYLSGEALTEIIKMGAVNSEWDGTFWTSDGRDHTGSATFDEPFMHVGDYDIAMNRIDIIPTGQIIFGLRQHMAGGLDNIISYGANQGLSLWAKKNNNPALSGDILIGRYNSDIYYNDFEAVGVKYNRQVPININEGGRSSWLPLITSGSGLVINASGRFETNWWASMPPSGRFNIYGMEITVSGVPYVPTGSGAASNFDMYTAGHLASTGNFNLIAFSEPPSGLFPLYIEGCIPSSGNFNIYMEGKINSSGNFDSYIYGHEDSTKSVMMFLKSPTLGSGLQGAEMVLVGPSQLPYSGFMPMVVYQNTSPNTSFDLFLQNDASAAYSGFNMFLKAPSGTYGSVPWSGVLPMYIARDSEGIDAGINMYIGAPNEESSGFSMYIDGANILANQFEISISGGGPLNSSINCFTHGF